MSNKTTKKLAVVWDLPLSLKNSKRIFAGNYTFSGKVLGFKEKPKALVKVINIKTVEPVVINLYVDEVIDLPDQVEALMQDNTKRVCSRVCVNINFDIPLLSMISLKHNQYLYEAEFETTKELLSLLQIDDDWDRFLTDNNDV